MNGCNRCPGDDNLAYSCNYCSGSFCSNHRLPENHNCPGLRNATTQGPDFRDVFDTDSGVLGRIFGDSGSEDAIAREHHPGMKDYKSDIHTDTQPTGYKPDTSSPDVNPDGSIKQQDGGQDVSIPSEESRVGGAAVTLVGLCILAVTLPFNILLNLPQYLRAFNRWLAQLLGALYGVAKTLAPIAVLLVIGLFVAGLIGTGFAPIDDTAQGSAGAVSDYLDADRSDRENSIQQAIHQEVNYVRSERGLSTLTFDHSVAAVARNHSEDMAERDFFRHQNPEGQNSGDRLRAAGIQCRAVGENIYRDEGFGTAPESTAERVVESWLNSPGHRENLLRRGWTAEGVGVEIRGDRVWVTQVFCG